MYKKAHGGSLLRAFSSSVDTPCLVLPEGALLVFHKTRKNGIAAVLLAVPGCFAGVLKVSALPPAKSIFFWPRMTAASSGCAVCCRKILEMHICMIESENIHFCMA